MDLPKRYLPDEIHEDLRMLCKDTKTIVVNQFVGIAARHPRLSLASHGEPPAVTDAKRD